MAEGRCNCASIKVSIPAMPEQSAICYCSNCRRAGSTVGSIVYVLEKTDVTVHDPGNKLKSYKDSDTTSKNTITRQFCSGCGSPVMSLFAGESSQVILKGGLFEHIPPPAFKSFEQEEPKWLKVTKFGEESL
ncbi:Mss4-like protein [Pyrenochaeta sp. MPI-SDFR-AT-0127]|nr:Mss4-like protein [Pyrenochaeta sp. MPI-SDFR-AT-0127]